MKQQQSSTSAEGLAAMRAVEASKPEEERICYDPVARSLTNPFSFAVIKLMLKSGIFGRYYPGAIEFITARERYIDDFLKARLDEGLDQVVLLGAGFDTRAYRIAGIENSRVFEIDHPATQEVKVKRLKKAIDPLPAHVTFVPMDFNSQTLEERLLPSGYDEKGRALFIWQGVTMYLTTAGIDSTLSFIAHHARAGSAVIFDYFYNEALRDTSRPEVKLMLRGSSAMGEAVLFGIDEGRVGQFLTQRGFHDVHNEDAEDLQRRYFAGPNAGRMVAKGAAVASATVDGS